MVDGMTSKSIGAAPLIFILLLSSCSSTVDNIAKPKYLDPKNDSIPEKFEIEYSWTGSFGLGDVYLYIHELRLTYFTIAGIR